MKVIVNRAGKDGKHWQAKVTIPKGLFEATGWKSGDVVAWEILGKDKLKLEKVKA